MVGALVILFEQAGNTRRIVTLVQLMEVWRNAVSPFRITRVMED